MSKGTSMITSLVGSNSYLIQSNLKPRLTKFETDFGNMSVEWLDGEEAEYSTMLQSLNSLPFLSTKKLIVIKNPNANKQFSENFEDLIKTIPDTVDIIFVVPKPDKRTSFYKLLQIHTEFIECPELSAYETPRWITNYVKTRGGKLSLDDANYLVQRVGLGQQMIVNEIDKLLIYSPDITKNTINLLTENSPQSTMFELLDSAFSGNYKRMSELYAEQRALKVEPQQILALIGWQLHVLAVIKTAGNKTSDQIAKEAHINPYVIRKSLNIANKINFSDIKRLVKDALELDVRLKSESIDADDAIQQYLLAIFS